MLLNSCTMAAVMEWCDRYFGWPP